MIISPTKDLVPINGMRLRMWRKNRNWTDELGVFHSGMSQQDLADHSLVSRSYIAELEKGTKRPRPLVADALATALDITVDELIS